MIDLSLLQFVPIGEETAASALEIWRRYGVWSPMGIRGKLSVMVAERLINRKIVPNSRASETSFYFRK